MLTVAIRDQFAAKMRELAETTGMSLAKLLGDMLLVYEGEVQGGYEPGTCLGQSPGNSTERGRSALPTG